MVKLILLSTDVIWDSARNAPIENVASSLEEIKKAGVTVFLISSHTEPAWLSKEFSAIRFCSCPFSERKSGAIVDRLIEINSKLNLKKSEILVLGAKDADFFMAVNSQSLLVRCGWASKLEDKIRNYGIGLNDPRLLGKLIRLLQGKKPWYFQASDEDLQVFSLTNAGTIGVTHLPSLNLINQLKDCLKAGEKKRKAAFNIHLLSSLNATEGFRDVDWWCCYPSSNPSNEEIMDDFVTLARTTFKKKSPGPLLIRHTPAPKRHVQGGDRTDPSSQLTTIHLNPKYRGKLEGATVAVLDDYLTYGVSFGVASALLRKAGATKVLAVSMGKFGRCARFYNIEIQEDDVFKPISRFDCKLSVPMVGVEEDRAHLEFVNKFTEVMG